MTGFELGQILAEPAYSTSFPVAVTGSAAIESSIVRSGSYSLKLTPASGAAGYWDWLSGATLSDHFVRFYLRVTVLPATNRGIFGNATTGIRLNTDGTLTTRGNGGTSTSTTALTDTTRWYRIEQYMATGGNGYLYIDGKLEANHSPTHGASALQFGANDTVAATYTAYIDDVLIATAVDETDAPGPGHVVMLLPTGLNAAGGWVEGDGAGTAGMAAAVATRPPPGVASASETSATNIESPTNSATDNCDMNMATYASAGISSLSGIVAEAGIVRHGEDIATGTKAGAVTIVSNPAQSGEDAFNFGNDGGAHAGEVGQWKTARGTFQEAPSVTLATAPVLRVGKRTATTRVVCVDFMGIYVAYRDRSLVSMRRHRNMIIR